MECRRFSKEEQAAVCLDYTEKRMSCRALQKKYKAGQSTINSILAANGIKARSVSESLARLKPEDEKNVCNMYFAQGLSLAAIASKIGLSNVTIRNIIKRRGRSCRNQGLSKAQVEGVVSSYEKDRKTIQEIADLYGCHPGTISRALRAEGVIMLTNSERQGGLPRALWEEVAARYELNSESTTELGSAYGVSANAIAYVLKQMNAKIRSPGAASPENIHAALCRCGHFSKDRETELYVCELHGYKDCYKVGISFDLDKRRRTAKGAYGNTVFVKSFPSRVGAFLVEQALLEKTIDHRFYPVELGRQKWGGATEVRRILKSDLVNIANCLIEEYDLQGAWLFASKNITLIPRHFKPDRSTRPSWAAACPGPQGL